MDEFVKSVVECILGKEKDAETIQIQNQNIYRPNYQRSKRGEQSNKHNFFYCIDIEPESKVKFETTESTDMLEEDLRWIRLNAREV